MVAKESVQQYLGVVGKKVPRAIKLGLTRFSRKFGYLFLEDGDFVFDRYLGEFKVTVNAKRALEREMLTGTYDPPLQELIRQEVRSGNICIDVGANIGAISMALAKQAGPLGQVYSFEPGPKYLERFRANLEMNPSLEKVIMPIGMGLSDRAGELFWVEDSRSPGNAGLLEDSGIRVPVTTLDLFCEQRKIPRIDFIKIDTEGMEGEVLRGAAELLRRAKPKIIFESSMEFEVLRGRPVRKEAADFLLGLGYRLFHIPETGEPRTSAHYPHFGQNLFAVPT